MSLKEAEAVGSKVQKNTDNAEINFWPGYVDAIFNFTLNILFVLALFVMFASIVEFSDEKVETSSQEQRDLEGSVSESAPDSLIDDISSLSGGGGDRSGGADITTQDIHIPPDPYEVQRLSNGFDFPNADNHISVSLRNIDENIPAVITIAFDDGESIISPNNEQRLGSIINDLQFDVREQRLLIWSTTDGRENTQSRLTFLRLMNVRRQLVDAGLPPELIDMRLIDVRDAGTLNQNQIFVATYNQNQQ